jgi:hypothetical protein
MDPRRVDVLPDPLVLDTLQFDDRVFVLEEYPRDWARVRTDDGAIGYTWMSKLFVGAPDPQAHLHLIKPGETALGIAQREYDCGEWGKDGRFFVNVLVAVNQASGDPNERKGIYKAGGRADDAVDSWKDTELLAGYYIWLPGESFARSLAGSVSSGSISYEFVQDLKALTGFVVGVLDGIATTLVDLVMDVVDLVGMIVDLVVDLARKGFTAKLDELREFFENLDVAEIASALWHDFEKRWNAADAWDRWKFRGLVTGMVLAEIALAVLTSGASVALRAAGKAGRLGKLASKLGKLDAVTDFAKKVDKAGDATSAGRTARKALSAKPHTDADIDKVFDDLEAGRIPQDGTPVQGSRKGEAGEVPDVAGGPEPGQRVPRELIAKTRNVLGKTIADAPEPVAEAWQKARRAVLGARGPLTRANYKTLYGEAQRKFWKNVRADDTAAQWFKDNGFSFKTTKSGAPALDIEHTARSRKEFSIELDHKLPKGTGDNWAKALDADNLQFLTGWDNWLLDQIERKLPELAR